MASWDNSAGSFPRHPARAQYVAVHTNTRLLECSTRRGYCTLPTSLQLSVWPRRRCLAMPARAARAAGRKGRHGSRGRSNMPVALLPAHLGGIGLQCAEHTAPAPYWAARADAPPVLRARRASYCCCLPAHCRGCSRCAPLGTTYTMVCAPRNATCLNPAKRAGSIMGSRACSFSRSRVVACPAAPCAGHAAFAVRAACCCMASAVPREAGSALPPDRMFIALRRRLRLPLPVAPHRGGAHGHGCSAHVDAYKVTITPHAPGKDCAAVERSALVGGCMPVHAWVGGWAGGRVGRRRWVEASAGRGIKNQQRTCLCKLDCSCYAATSCMINRLTFSHSVALGDDGRPFCDRACLGIAHKWQYRSGRAGQHTQTRCLPARFLEIPRCTIHQLSPK